VDAQLLSMWSLIHGRRRKLLKRLNISYYIQNAITRRTIRMGKCLGRN
jgi:hypothetical protein